jgi:hypothetical protein
MLTPLSSRELLDLSPGRRLNLDLDDVEIEADLDTNCFTEPREDFIICGILLIDPPAPKTDVLEEVDCIDLDDSPDTRLFRGVGEDATEFCCCPSGSIE